MTLIGRSTQTEQKVYMCKKRGRGGIQLSDFKWTGCSAVVQDGGFPVYHRPRPPNQWTEKEKVGVRFQ